MQKRIFFLLLSLVISLLTLLGQTFAETPRVTLLQVKGPIVPVVADYIQRGIDEAEKNGSLAVIIVLDTPGGLVSATQKIIQTILASPVPVVVYVSPPGAWAGSAGAFITLAGHVAAMAPGTFIGAAHPVALTPGQQGEMPRTQEEKIVNALASAIRSIAEQRGRNVELAEDMVRKSVAKTDAEALSLGLIDLRATDINELLRKLETEIGEVTVFGGRKVTLKTAGATVEPMPMNAIERLFFILSDPNIAYILLSISMLAIFVELSNPGLILPGVVGGVGLFLSLYSLGVLGARWAGIALIFLAFGLLLAEAFITSHGALAAGGLTSLIIGSLLLFSGSPVFKISPVVIVTVALIITGLFVFVISAIVRSHRRPQPTGREGMIGLVGIARTLLNPKGTVMVRGELWEAIAEDGIIESGDEIVVTGIEGLKLRVRKRSTVDQVNRGRC